MSEGIPLYRMMASSTSSLGGGNGGGATSSDANSRRVAPSIEVESQLQTTMDSKQPTYSLTHNNNNNSNNAINNKIDNDPHEEQNSQAVFAAPRPLLNADEEQHNSARPTITQRIFGGHGLAHEVVNGPNVKVNVAFKEIEVVVPRSKRVLLSNVTGVAESGKILAVMGSSGSGKSTFLKAISSGGGNSRRSLKTDSNVVLFNGSSLSAAKRRAVVSYVPQHEALIGELTVRESIRFAALLEFGYAADPGQLEDRCNDVIRSVGLTSVANAPRVGNAIFKGLSGGQRRRLSIAVELITNPAVILLDEPTTGLDTTAAAGIFTELDRLAKRGHTIIAVIHQPPSRVWETIFNLLLIQEGRPIYFGSASQVLSHFSEFGFFPPPYCNPADFCIELLHGQYRSSRPTRVESDGQRLPSDASHATSVVHNVSEVIDALDKAYHEKLEPHALQAFNIVASHVQPAFAPNSISARAGMASKTVTLIERNCLLILRNPAMFILPLSMHIGIALFLGLLYIGVGGGLDDQSLRSTISALLGGVAFLCFLSMLNIPFLMANHETYLREYRSGMVFVLPHMVALIIVMFPLTAFFSIVSTSIFCALIQLSNGLFIGLTIWLLLLCSDLVSNIAIALTRDMVAAITTSIVWLALCALTSGFFKPFEQVTWVIRWAGYSSYLRYGFRAAMEAQFADKGAYDSVAMPNGTAVLQYYTITDDANLATIGDDLAVLVGFVLGLVIFLGLALSGWVSGK